MIFTNSCLSISRWIARIGSLLVIGFLLAFLFGEGLPPITILHLCFPLGVMMGLIVAWFLEGIGATITIVSITAFYLIHYRLSGVLPSGPFFLIAAAPSLFFLISKFMRPHIVTEMEYDD
jgi:hypothetical protein